MAQVPSTSQFGQNGARFANYTGEKGHYFGSALSHTRKGENIMKHFTGYWCGGVTHTTLACNGDDAWKQLIRWATANNIQFPTQFTMTRSR